MSKSIRSQDQQTQLDRLVELPDEQIDTTDMPELSAKQWTHARRGLYRPIKKPVTLRLDVDVVSWFRVHAQEGGYQTEINRVLRQHVEKAEGHVRI